MRKVWIDKGGDPRRYEYHVRREVWDVQGRSRRKDKGKASTKEEGDFGKTVRDRMRVVKRGGRNENVSARPNGLRENAETAIFVYY